MSVNMQFTENIEICFAYSHKDEKRKDKLNKHFRSLQREGVRIYWYKNTIQEGYDWYSEMPHNLNTAHIIGLLISPDFLNDSWYQQFVRQAMRRHLEEEICVIPILLRSVDFRGEPYDKLRVLPSNGEPVDSRFWKNQGNQDKAFFDIAQDIRAEIEEIRTKIRKYQEHQQRLERYENNFKELYLGNPLSNEDRQQLNNLRKHLNITEEDAAQVKNQVIRAITKQTTSQSKLISGAFFILIITIVSILSIRLFVSSVSMSSEELSEQGTTHYEQKDFQKAIDKFSQAIKREPNNDTYYHKRANSYYSQNNFQKAIEDYTQAIRIKPDNATYYNYRGHAYYRQNNFQKAIEDYTQAIRLDPNNSEAYEYRGYAQSKLGDRQR